MVLCAWEEREKGLVGRAEEKGLGWGEREVVRVESGREGVRVG